MNKLITKEVGELFKGSDMHQTYIADPKPVAGVYDVLVDDVIVRSMTLTDFCEEHIGRSIVLDHINEDEIRVTENGRELCWLLQQHEDSVGLFKRVG